MTQTVDNLFGWFLSDTKGKATISRDAVLRNGWRPSSYSRLSNLVYSRGCQPLNRSLFGTPWMQYSSPAGSLWGRWAPKTAAPGWFGALAWARVPQGCQGRGFWSGIGHWPGTCWSDMDPFPVGRKNICFDEFCQGMLGL